MIGRGQVEAQHPEDRPQKALRLTKGQVKGSGGASARFRWQPRSTAAALRACRRPRPPTWPIASGVNHRVTSPRWTSARSYAGQFPTRYFVVYLGCTLDFTSRSCPFGRHDGQGHDEHLFPRTNAALSRTLPWTMLAQRKHSSYSGSGRRRHGPSPPHRLRSIHARRSLFCGLGTQDRATDDSIVETGTQLDACPTQHLFRLRIARQNQRHQALRLAPWLSCPVDRRRSARRRPVAAVIVLPRASLVGFAFQAAVADVPRRPHRRHAVHQQRVGLPKAAFVRTTGTTYKLNRRGTTARSTSLLETHG